MAKAYFELSYGISDITHSLIYKFIVCLAIKRSLTSSLITRFTILIIVKKPINIHSILSLLSLFQIYVMNRCVFEITYCNKLKLGDLCSLVIHFGIPFSFKVIISFINILVTDLKSSKGNQRSLHNIVDNFFVCLYVIIHWSYYIINHCTSASSVFKYSLTTRILFYCSCNLCHFPTQYIILSW